MRKTRLFVTTYARTHTLIFQSSNLSHLIFHLNTYSSSTQNFSIFQITSDHFISDVLNCVSYFLSRCCQANSLFTENSFTWWQFVLLYWLLLLFLFLPFLPIDFFLFSLPQSLSVCLSVGRSVCRSVSLSVCLSVCLSIPRNSLSTPNRRKKMR